MRTTDANWTLTPARLVVGLAFVGIFAMAARVSVDPDTWWHLRAGQWMVEHGQVLMHDPFSSTRFGEPWINHSWLTEIPLYLLWRASGYAGLNLATAALVTLAFVLVYAQCEGSAYLKAFVLVLAAAASAVYWSARPQLVSFVLTAAVAYLLGQFRWRGLNRLWLLPPLVALWVNLHGGFALGFMLLLITLAGQMLSRLLGQSGAGVVDRRGLLWLAGITAACALLVSLNPYGPAMYLYPLRTVSIGVLQDYIQEWQSPNFHMREAQIFIWLWLVTLAALGLARRRLDLTDLLLLSAFSYLALLAARNISIFALLAPPIITRHAASGLEHLRASHPRLATVLDPPPARRNLPALNWALLGLTALAALIKVADVASTATNERLLAERLPFSAAAYVESNRPPGPLFNSYNWGGFLSWRLYPEYQVFVDGRTDLYDDPLLREYLDTALARPGYERVLDKHGTNLVFVEAGSPLDTALRQNARWRLLYGDQLAVVFGRVGAAAGAR